MGISKQLIVSISEEFVNRNNIKNSTEFYDGITFHKVGKNSNSVVYLGYKLEKSYSFYKGYVDNGQFNYKEIFSMPIYIGSF